jgi:hypothetical protein
MAGQLMATFPQHKHLSGKDIQQNNKHSQTSARIRALIKNNESKLNYIIIAD